MDLETTDFCLSGLSRLGIAETSQRMLEIDTVAPVSELLIWDFNGDLNHTTFDERTGLGDINGIIEIDFNTISRIMVVLKLSLAGIATSMNIAAFSSENRTVIEGQFYISHVLDAGALREELLIDLSELTVKLARIFEAIFLVVADEDDDSAMIDSSGLRLPNLFGVFDTHLIQNVENSLVSNGAMVVESDNDCYRIIWLDSLERIIDDAQKNEAVLEVLHMLINDLISR